MRKFILLVTFSSLTLISHGNDTLLYKKRTEKIKALAEWLNKRPMQKLDSLTYATSSLWKMYDSAVNLFLDRRYLNSNYDVKSAIYYFDYILASIKIDSIILKMPNPLVDTLIETKNYPSYFRNTIILYLPIWGQEFEGVYFAFAEGKADLIYIIEAGGTTIEYKEKKSFLNNLYKG